jgi:hypothetical protein
MIFPFRGRPLTKVAAVFCSIFGSLVLFSCAALREQTIPSPLAGELLERVRTQNAGIKSFVARGEIVVDAPGGAAYRGRETMAAMGDSAFLLKVFTPANAPVLYLSAANDQVTLVDFAKRTYTKIPVQGGFFPLTRGLRISTDYFTRIAVGNVPLLPNSEFSAFASEKSNEARLVLKGNGPDRASQLIRIKLQPPRTISGVTLRENGKVQYEVSFDDYASVDGMMVPMVVVIEIPGKRTRFTIKHSQMLINLPLDSEQLTIEPPAFFSESSG